jgi:uncharacterized protein (TIGR03067 family)
MKPEIEKLQGTWNIVSLEVDGQKYPPGGSRIAIRGDHFDSLNMGAEYSGTMAVNASASPKTFDLAFETGPEKGKVSLGIYELDGDKWTICLGLAGVARPTRFVSAPGTGHALERLKRDRGAAEKQIPVADDLAASVAELEGEWCMVSCLQDGQPMDPGFVKTAKREFRGNTTTLLVGGRPLMKSHFTADSTRKFIEYLDLRQQGIYQVSGDTLRTCLVVSGETRPADFSATPGDGRTVSEWRRKSAPRGLR